MSFQKPVNGNLIQRFGADFQNPDGSWYYKKMGYKGHNGDDYAVPVGTPVYAADEGTIVFEGWGQNHSWMGVPAGICVLINNGGLYSGYAHLSSTCVSKGQYVNKGQQIGLSGQTGAATGPHVHFEAIPLAPNFANGYAARIDPQPYMDAVVNTASVAEVQQAYRDILEREADQAGIDTYTQKTIEFVRADLAASPEHAQLMANKAAAQAAADAAARAAEQQAETARMEAEKVAADAKAKAEADAAALAAVQAKPVDPVIVPASAPEPAPAAIPAPAAPNPLVRLLFEIIIKLFKKK